MKPGQRIDDPKTFEQKPGDIVVDDPLKPLVIRTFATGATRDTDNGKYDYEGFYSPLVIERFGQYMHKHRIQADGTLRAPDNWQHGIPTEAYMKSAFRHFMDWWKQHRGYPGQETIEDSLCALIFNAQGYLFEILKEKASRVTPKV